MCLYDSEEYLGALDGAWKPFLWSYTVHIQQSLVPPF